MSFCVLGHCGKFCYALWASRANLVVRYRQLLQNWPYATGHCGGFSYVLWATARNEAIQKMSVTISALWAIAQDLVMCYGP
jgi:hypothetical protein